MSDSTNPFTEYVTRSKTSRAAGLAIGILAVVTVLLLAGLIWFGSVIRQERQERESLRAKLEQAAFEVRTTQATSAERLDAINKLRERVADLEKEKAMAVQSARGLEEQMRAELESKDVTISKLQGKLTVNILDRILFDSGEAVLKPDGETVLNKIAAILAQHPELKIHVIGHTDNVPIRASARSRFASNWELSTARALAAVRYLTEHAGVEPQRLGAVGYGEFRPIADNATPEGRARNRRIAVTILADELAGADTGPASPIPTATNIPPPVVEPRPTAPMD
ncbi:MAG: OmpA family protein [Verrucomicrobiota bacterium]